MRKPFVEGPVAAGRYFIGRARYLARCAGAAQYGGKECFAICGLPRIGKSSIVQKLLKTKSKKVLPAYVILGSNTSYFDLWKEIIRELFNRLKKANEEDAEILADHRKRVDQACEAKILAALNEYLEDFFRELSREKYKCVIAIDEFDQIRADVFGDRRQCGIYLNALRNLFTQKPDIRLSLIVISRRDIGSLVNRCADEAGSTFPGVFGGNIIGVTGFDDGDYETYLEKLKKNKVELTKKIENDLETYGGRSPFLLAQIGNYLCGHSAART